jgi:hypothetical protein
MDSTRATAETDLQSELASAQTVFTDRRTEGITRTLIVPGFSEYRAARAIAVPDLHVLGIQSITEYKDASGAAHADLRHALDGASPTDVVIWLQDTNSDSWDAGRDLALHLEMNGAASVKFARPPSGFSFSQYAKLPEGKAEFALTTLLSKAGPIGRRPKAPSRAKVVSYAALAPIVDPDRGIIYVPGASNGEGQPPSPDRILLAASAVRLRTYRVFDDLRDPKGADAQIFHDLRITVESEGEISESEVSWVPDSDLVKTRVWLNRVRNGPSIIADQGADAAFRIEAAIRGHEADLVPEINVIRRTGWASVEGTAGFSHAAGFATAAGRTQQTRSQLPGNLGSIEIMDTNEISVAQELAAAKALLAIKSELTDPNVFTGIWGTIFHTVSGLHVGAVPVVYGGAGSGKTHIMQCAAALTHPFGLSPLITSFDASSKNIAAVGSHLESLFVIVDDSRKQTSQRQIESQAQAVEHLTRPGYGGGKVRYSSKVQDVVTKKWEQGVPDPCSPATFIVGEQLPDGDNLNSTKERFYPVQIRGNPFASGNGRHIAALSSTGDPQVHFASFIRWVAAGIDLAGGLSAWKLSWNLVRKDLEDARAVLPVSIRVREVATVPALGMTVWAAYLVNIGALTSEESAEMLAEVTATVDANALSHGTVNVTQNGAPAHEMILNSMRAALVSDRAFLARLNLPVGSPEIPTNIRELTSLETSSYSNRLLGHVIHGRGGTGSFVAIQPGDALAILAYERRWRDLSETDLYKAFAEVSLTDGGGKMYKSATIFGLRTKVLAIPKELFFTDGEPDPASTDPTLAEPASELPVAPDVNNFG